MGENHPEYERINESLKSLGLTKYEALVYMALLKVKGATATEIHEISKVPRASVYPVIEKLIKKSLVSISNTTPRRFSATPPEDAVRSILGSIKNDADSALKVLKKIYEERQESPEGSREFIWSISGEDNIKSKIREILPCAEEEVLFLGKWDFIKSSVLDILDDMDGRVRTEIITKHWEGKTPPNTSVYLLKEMAGCDDEAKDSPSGVYIVDRKRVLLAMDSESSEEGPNALYSESYGFVNFFVTYWNFVNRHLNTLKDFQG